MSAQTPSSDDFQPERPVLAELEVGQELFTRTYAIDRALLVRYAGASGDFNPIHYNERVAREVGLPGVIAHGMATMGLAASAVEDWADDPGAVTEYGVRFTRPVEVPDPGTAEIEVVGRVGALDLAAGSVRVDLAVTSGGASVLAKAQAVVRLA
ncbi:MaoC family dehydratase [Georgenia sp. SYP-B2076]|uniref:MaoC family dehydratase n=1 Tax=Georgenia sp. SYP-B2076 TaxID=2495881 RepID=UPI000F8F7D9F|nr:MaoC family dehydratase [Georgenia sp. SYP-B2076]